VLNTPHGSCQKAICGSFLTTGSMHLFPPRYSFGARCRRCFGHRAADPGLRTSARADPTLAPAHSQTVMQALRVGLRSRAPQLAQQTLSRGLRASAPAGACHILVHNRCGREEAVGSAAVQEGLCERCLELGRVPPSAPEPRPPKQMVMPAPEGDLAGQPAEGIVRG
jgi:hypothetical protein